jgi:LmbE family N-acetylglucosaminyl deacetylase
MELQGPVLVVGAHPDDPEFGAGGTVAAFTAAGQAVHYIVCTDGSKGSKDRAVQPADLVRRRQAEQRGAAEELGVSSVTFLEQVDGEMENTRCVRLRIARRIRELRPHVLITHDAWRPWMLHPDHRATGFAVTDAFVAARDHLYLPELLEEGLEPWPVPELWLWGTLHPDHWVDTSATLERKLAALRHHESQISDFAALDERLRQGARETGEPQGMAYAEAFKRLGPR